MRCTVTLKYKSLMVCDTSATVPRPNMMPSAKPSVVPTTPRISASSRMKRKTCPRVVPSERMMPMVLRRCTTLKLTVL